MLDIFHYKLLVVPAMKQLLGLGILIMVKL